MLSSRFARVAAADRATCCARTPLHLTTCTARRVAARAVPQSSQEGEQALSDVEVPARRTLFAGAAGIMLVPLLGSSPAMADGAITTVFVAGATGNTGRRVVQQLRAKGYKVRAGVRDEGKARELGLTADSGITVVRADVTKGPQVLSEAIGDAQAVISAIGGGNLLFGGAAKVDEKGAINLIDAAKGRGVTKFVMVSSLLTNAVAIGQANNPNYALLNFFGGVLERKLAAEKYLRASGLDWTIVRPGGLSNDPPEEVGNVIPRPEDTLFGRETDPGVRVSRDTVAAVVVEALQQPSASNKVVEIVASPDAPVLPPSKWFP